MFRPWNRVMRNVHERHIFYLWKSAMPTTGRYQTYLPNIYSFSSGVQFLPLQVMSTFTMLTFSLTALFVFLYWQTKPLTFKRTKHIIARLKRKLHYQSHGSRVPRKLRVSSLVSLLRRSGSRLLGPTCGMCSESCVSGPTKNILLVPLMLSYHSTIFPYV